MTLEDFVRDASKQPVIDGVGEILRNYIGRNEIIDPVNPLVRDSISILKRHYAGTLALPSLELKTFLAASSLSHMLDGWMYLSNAYKALLSGDDKAAVHFGYYAELRSAMSILATEGIGIFNTQHIGIDSANHCMMPPNGPKGNGTHTFVWDVLDKWTDSAVKPDDAILNIFHVRGLSFHQLTEYFHPTAAGLRLTNINVVKHWLKEWCLDIQLYTEDRNGRNAVSYRPQRIDNFGSQINFKDIIGELNSYWNVLSPSNTDNFSLLDSHLLRKLFRTLYNTIPAGKPPLRELIESAFEGHGLSDNNLVDFLSGLPPYNAEHSIFTYASHRNSGFLSVFARATLLLRISVGVVSQLYQNGGITKDQLGFVWNNYAVDNGFWRNGSMPPDFKTLWADIEESISDLESDINAPSADVNIASINMRRPAEIINIGQINRACLWGLNF